MPPATSTNETLAFLTVLLHRHRKPHDRRPFQRGGTARIQAPAAAVGLPTLADKGYQGASIGVHTPIKGRGLGVDNRAHNGLLAGIRAIDERANALLTQRWSALRRITHSPSKIGAIVASALVLTTLERGTR